jgi:hypothetical protein
MKKNEQGLTMKTTRIKKRKQHLKTLPKYVFEIVAKRRQIVKQVDHNAVST